MNVTSQRERHERSLAAFVPFALFRGLREPSRRIFFTYPTFSPSADGSRTILERLGDSGLLYWDKKRTLSWQKVVAHGAEMDRPHPLRDKVLVP